MTETTNIHGTDDGNLTTVLPEADVRGQLGDLRRQHGAESPIGHRCTNLLELLESFDKERDRDALKNIIASLDRQKADLDQLLAVCRGNH